MRLLRGWLVVCGMLAVAGGAVAAPAGAAQAPTGDVGLRLVDGFWQGQVGLADNFGNANQGLVLPVAPSSPSFVVAASIDGVAGLDSGQITGLGFAVKTPPSGINPCWKVTTVDGSVFRTSIDSARGIGLEGGWTQYTFPPLAPGITLSSIELEVHVVTPPPVGDQVIFDNVTINQQTFTFAGDSNRAAATDPVG